MDEAAVGAEGDAEESADREPDASADGSIQVRRLILLTDLGLLVKIRADGKKTSLGSTTVRVEEFQLDRLQVKTEIVSAPAQGWLTPDAAKARITVRSLFGTPAAGGLAKLELTAKSWSGQVPGYGEYRFRSGGGAGIPHLPQDLGEAQTDAQGVATFDLSLAAGAFYRSGGGRAGTIHLYHPHRGAGGLNLPPLPIAACPE